MNNSRLMFEDLRVGDTWKSKTREVTQGEIHEFADLTGDYNPIHLDAEYAAKTPFGEPIAHGLLGLSVMAGLSTDAPRVHTTALVDIRGWKFCKPVYVGDEIHVVTQVSETKERGRRHGEVQWYQRLINQRNEVVQEGMLTTLVAKRVPSRRDIDSPSIPAAPSVTPAPSNILDDSLLHESPATN